MLRWIIDPTPSSSGLSRGSAEPSKTFKQRAQSPPTADTRDKPEHDDFRFPR